MRKIYAVMIIMVFSFNVPARSFLDSEWIEPTMFCAIGGGVGYATQVNGTQQNQIIYSAGGCVAGAILGYFLNKRYHHKYGKQYQDELKAMQKTIREMQIQQAQRGESLDLEANDYLIQKEIVPGQKLPNGDILSPTIKYRLTNPGQDLRVGD